MSRSTPYGREYALQHTIPDEDIAQLVVDVYALVLARVEGQEAAWYASLERFARGKPKSSGFYDLRRGASGVIRLLSGVLTGWPPQEPVGIGMTAHGRPGITPGSRGEPSEEGKDDDR